MRIAQVLVLHAAAGIAAFAVGCGPHGEAGAPGGSQAASSSGRVTSDLQEVAYGAEKKLTYQPEQVGTLYVYDDAADQFIYTGRLRKDQKFEIDPANARATINGQPLGIEIDPKHTYRIYFSATK